MRDWELRVDDVADPVAGPGQVLTKVLACGICGSDLHMLKHGAELRRLAVELEAESPPDPMRPIPFEPDCRHRDGARVLLRGRRARTGREQPDAGAGGGQHAGRVRRRRHPRRRILEPLPGRVRRAVGAQRVAGDPRPRRCPTVAGGDDRAPRGRRPRREQEPDHRARRGDRARARPGRAGMCRRAQDAWHRPRRSAPTSRRGGGASPSTSDATSSSTPATSG